MAESGGVDGEGGRSDGESGGSDEYEYVTLTAAEVLEKLEEVMEYCVCACVCVCTSLNVGVCVSAGMAEREVCS